MLPKGNGVEVFLIKTRVSTLLSAMGGLGESLLIHCKVRIYARSKYFERPAS